MTFAKRGFLLTAAVALIGLAGCGKDETPPASKPSTPAVGAETAEFKILATSDLRDVQPLEEMVASYERGMRLLRVCRSRIETARQRVELITADFEGRGKASLGEFTTLETPEPAPAAEETPRRQPRRKPASPENPPASPGEDAGDIRLF